MKRRGFLLKTAMVILLLATGLFLSCGSLPVSMPQIPVLSDAIQSLTDPEPSLPTMDSWTYRVGWSWYTNIPNKDFTVVGIIVVRNVTNPTFELMEAAKALGANDIINARVDTREEKDGTILLAASAVAIKYNDTIVIGYPEVGEKLFDSGAIKWSKYTTVPNKDFSVVNIVTVNCDASQTPAADLMEEANRLGAHDIINILVDTEQVKGSRVPKVVRASAVAIRYKDVGWSFVEVVE